jgi:hypothetical protein
VVKAAECSGYAPTPWLRNRAGRYPNRFLVLIGLLLVIIPDLTLL